MKTQSAGWSDNNNYWSSDPAGAGAHWNVNLNNGNTNNNNDNNEKYAAVVLVG